MDIATLLGLVGGIAIIFTAIMGGSDPMLFVNPHGIMIVVGGTLAATLIKFPLSHCFGAFRIAFKAFRYELDSPVELIRHANNLAAIVRRNGVLALDGQPVRNAFLSKGIQLAIDGLPPEFVRKALREDMEQSLERHENGQKIFRAVGASATAFGLVGTLVVLVQMLGGQQDGAVGPSLAFALLPALYGILIAQLITLPIADKLELRSRQERLNALIMIDSMLSIQQGQNPRVMDEVLEAYIPHHERERLASLLKADKPSESEG